jgi:UvrB/uvrC motif
METAAEQEDYDKAEELQNQIDDIQSNQIPPLIDELLNAQEDEEPSPASVHSEKEDQQEIIEDEPYEPPSLGLFSGV